MQRLIFACLFVTGCGLYWGSGGGDDQCKPTPAPDIPAIGYRNPSTGSCEYQTYGGDCCGGQPCAYNGIAQPDWGMCNSQCDALDESTCIATADCHAAYLEIESNGPVTTTFLGCWQTSSNRTAPSACAGLDAEACDGRDDCSMLYTNIGVQQFSACIAETQGSCGVDIGCPIGSHCSEQCTPCNSIGCSDTCTPTCVPDTTCAQTDCGAGYQCVEQCNALVGPCQPTCVPTGNNPGSCSGQITCNSAPPQCPVNTTAGISNGCWTGYCIPNAQCTAPDPGDCYAPVTCNMAPPSCPSGTLPGVTNGCYSGFCIPTYSCELAACETLGTESACDARSDCTPVYTGTDCTCTMTGGCTCATETYNRCESLIMPL